MNLLYFGFDLSHIGYLIIQLNFQNTILNKIVYYFTLTTIFFNMTFVFP